MKFFIASTALLMVALTQPVVAGEDLAYSFEPEQPDSSDTVRFRLDFEGCFDTAIVTNVDLANRIVEVVFHTEDVGCDESNPENFVSPKFWDIGMLPPGSYTARISICGGLVPPNSPPCSVSQETLLTVSGDGEPTTAEVIPATRIAGEVALGTMLLLLGGSLLRRR